MAVWKSASGSNVPPDAWQAGNNHGQPLYVARAWHEGDLIPGKVSPGNNFAYFSWGGGEHGKADYEVLCGGGYSWVGSSGSNPVPGNAVAGGNTSGGETLYCGHVSFNGVDLCGKVHLSHGKCYAPELGVEHAFDNYEVLVRN